MIKKKEVKDLTSQALGGSAGAGIGTLIGGPAGGVVGAAFGGVLPDVFSRLLGAKEKERVERVADLAKRKINEKVENGAKVKDSISKKTMNTLLEGVLLSARDSYEEKKLPFLANIVATAPFTNTPEENIIQSLKNAEQLSYRQLCILGIIGRNQWSGGLGLNEVSYKEKYASHPRNKERDGVYFDVLNLIDGGFVIQMESDGQHITNSLVISGIAPARLRLYYPGTLLFNCAELDSIDQKDLNNVAELLK